MSNKSHTFFLLWLFPCEVCHRLDSKISVYLQSAIQMERICRIGQMVYPRLLFPSPSASPFCAYSSEPPKPKTKKKTKMKSTISQMSYLEHLLNLLKIDNKTVSELLTWTCCHAQIDIHQHLGLMLSQSKQQDSHFHQTSKISNMLTLPLSICLHVLCQFSHKNLSITSPINPPEDGPDTQSYSPECLSNFRLPTFGFHGCKKREQEMIICISANLSSQTLTDKMNAVKPWHDGRFCASMPKCVKNSSTHLSFNNAMGCHLAFTRSHWWEEDTVPFPPPRFPPKIDPTSRVLLGSSESSLSWHIVRELRKVAICPGISNPNFKYKRDMIPLNLDQIPLSLQTSVTHCWRVWTLI